MFAFFFSVLEDGHKRLESLARLKFLLAEINSRAQRTEHNS